MKDPGIDEAAPSEAQEGSKAEQADPSLRSIPAPVDGVRSAASPRECPPFPVPAGTALAALKTELREQERHRLLKEINAWLLDQAEADDVDGAEYDADFCRKIARDLAEHFKPC